MAWFKKEKKEGLHPKNKPNGVSVAVDRTTIARPEIRNITDPVDYAPYSKFNKDLKAWATFFYIPSTTHEIIRKNPKNLYPLDMTDPLKKGKKAKPVSYSINLMDLFARKEGTQDRGKVYFGKIRVFEDEDEKGGLKENDIGMYELFKQYTGDFFDRFSIDPTEINGKSALDFPDPRREIDSKTGKVKIHGLDDISRKHFTLYRFPDEIKIADGRLIKGYNGDPQNQPSQNGTFLFDVNWVPHTLSATGRKTPLETIARPDYPQTGKPFDYAFASFGYQIFNNPDLIIRHGYTFMMLVTPKPLLIPENQLRMYTLESLTEGQVKGELEKFIFSKLTFDYFKKKYNIKKQVSADQVKDNIRKGKLEPLKRKLKELISDEYGVSLTSNESELREKYGLKEHFAFSDAR